MGRVDIREIEASGILTPQKKGSSIGYDYSLNPYVGCAFGCSYCYVREMQYGDDAGEKSETWGNWVKVKANAVALMQKSWRRLYGKRIMVGTATDPYQPVERRLRLTRSLLEFLAMAYPARLHVQTRSPAVTLDVDVFRRFEEDVLSVGLSIPTDDDAVRKVFEPSAPSIPQRIAALKALHEAGIRTTVFFAPLLPCHPERLADLCRPYARTYMLDEMRYHRTDTAMAARYRNNGWQEWLRPDFDDIRQRFRAAWEA